MNSLADACSERPLLLPPRAAHPWSTVLTVPLEKPWALPPFALLGNPQGCGNTRLSARAMTFAGAFASALTTGETSPIHMSSELALQLPPMGDELPYRTHHFQRQLALLWRPFFPCRLPLHRGQVCLGIKISVCDPRVALAIPLCLFADVLAYFILSWAYSASLHGHDCCHFSLASLSSHPHQQTPIQTALLVSNRYQFCFWQRAIEKLNHYGLSWHASVPLCLNWAMLICTTSLSCYWLLLANLQLYHLPHKHSFRKISFRLMGAEVKEGDWVIPIDVFKKQWNRHLLEGQFSSPTLFVFPFFGLMKY